MHMDVRVEKVNPLTPKGDQHLISPYNITPVSHIKVMRIKKMINSPKKLLIVILVVCT